MPLRDLEIFSTYIPSEDPVNSFYGPSLTKANDYIRAAGYFRSTLIELIPEYLHSFVVNGGKIKLLCSPNLIEKDVKIIFDSTIERNKLINFEVDKLLDALKIGNREKIFASLIKFKILDIKFVFKKRGIFHEKWGILTDDQKDRVYFSGKFLPNEEIRNKKEYLNDMYKYPMNNNKLPVFGHMGPERFAKWEFHISITDIKKQSDYTAVKNESGELELTKK